MIIALHQLLRATFVLIAALLISSNNAPTSTTALAILPPAPKTSISIVTGASGFVGRSVVNSLLTRIKQQQQDDDDDDNNVDDSSRKEIVICLVRPNRVSYEESYWNARLQELEALPPTIVTDDKGTTTASTDNANDNSTNTKNVVCVKVMPYDMLDGGNTLYDALQSGFRQRTSSSSTMCCSICVYHIASVFGPTPDPIQTAMDNVQSAEDVVKSLDKFRHELLLSSQTIKGNELIPDESNDFGGDGIGSSSSSSSSNSIPKLRLVLTSSMAAVRATNQPPLNDKFYTHRDWNTLSQLDGNNWGSCYQWSKAESEKRAWGLVKKRNEKWENGNTNGFLEMVALCPSFVFGPPPPLPASLKKGDNKTTGGSSSYSLTLLKQWLEGKSPVQSRLCADVRDVADAHVAAGSMELPITRDYEPTNMRYVLSTEERLSSELVAEALKRAIQCVQEQRTRDIGEIDMSKITCDTKFDGGAIKIGEQEVEATERLKRDLGVVFRSVEQTMQDMAEALLLGDSF